ncbi:hypothetical protein CDCA_CDCA17G4421 [Cyanidium caldarium]|uniref:histone acetyltransferase n=1 Tax=Cyanidium caldarium TaxID=2771 RepID=A0AAV9J1V3_CYACA|nr:hypothetical protein CDCA_CDCA17G4421 [Cyanidium caldarium]
MARKRLCLRQPVQESGGMEHTDRETSPLKWATQAAAAPPETVNAREALRLHWVHSAEDLDEDNQGYAPMFVHQLFADEQIRGYRSPRLRCYFASRTLKSFIRFDHDGEIEGADGDRTDVARVIDQHVPLSCGRFAHWDAFCQHALEEQHSTTVPFRAVVDSYKIDGQTYTVYRSVLADPAEAAGRAFHARAQFLMLVSIDAASYIDDRDGRWSMYAVFADASGRFIGYATVCRFAGLFAKGQDQPPVDEMSRRARVAQMVVLPPYQGCGHGRHLLQSMYVDLTRPSSAATEAGAQSMPPLRVVEITVEDPSPAFSRLRDAVDVEWVWRRRDRIGQWARSIGHDTDAPTEAQLREYGATTCLTAVQLRRVYELLRFRALQRRFGSEEEASSDEALAAYRQYRLSVKRRLYREHAEVLEPASDAERKAQLDELYHERVHASYCRTLAALRANGCCFFPPESNE